MRRAPAAVIPTLLLLVTLASTGAWYEWGGPAARGLKQLKEGKTREAVTSLEEARRERPRSSAVRYDQALGFTQSGLPDSAAAAYHDARSLEGAAGRSAAAFNEGNAAYHSGKMDDAIQAYRAALRDDPKRADAKRNLEEALRRARASSRMPQTGNQGESGNGSGGTGQRQGGNTPPPPGGPNEPKPSARGDRSSKASLGSTPNQQEAEHWLDALEAERRAGRAREQAARRLSGDARGDRDW